MIAKYALAGADRLVFRFLRKEEKNGEF